MLKTSNSKLTKLRKGLIRIGGDSRKEYADRAERDNRCKFDKSEVDSGEIGDNEVRKKC